MQDAIKNTHEQFMQNMNEFVYVDMIQEMVLHGRKKITVKEIL